ncbi:RNA polymerase sigma factor [Tengunoibacter tsumagoiensis]|uniref:RNA polymerase sigma factor n=1 Tax=Tengunoibacter tsumagoiensis TaxID=2014871 RepID=A0A402A0W2_9CHLR|nr:RNA polymerase sigma factor [Tengunoibacter tsumagoiensis]GCE12651.1 RNA polymerase sigma factor [Tengunoibacter tsumagoiensis]
MNAVENETQLVIDACQGSVPAFESLMIYYEPRIRRLLYGMTQDPQLTQDLCQETFLAAYRALPRMNGIELRFSSWLYRIALNLVRSEWRKRKHVMLVPFTASYLGADESTEETLIGTEEFEERIAQRDLLRLVLEQLPEASVSCLLLDAEGFSYTEIAEIHQESLSAIRSRLSRARQAFQRIYVSLDQEGRR